MVETFIFDERNVKQTLNFQSMPFLDFLKAIGSKPLNVLDPNVPLSKYTTLDLSTGNKDIIDVILADPVQCQNYISRVLKDNKATVAYGGYLEKRNLYTANPNFSSTGKPSRNIHLGIDFWAMAGTRVVVPVDGTVHSFKNNAVMGDYGPTIILRHAINGFSFHSLYGHLSLASLEGLYKGRKFKKGEILGTLGTADINMNYAPHLHFQLIVDMADKKGDYPGVCAVGDMEFYSKNCPDPNLLLKM